MYCRAKADMPPQLPILQRRGRLRYILQLRFDNMLCFFVILLSQEEFDDFWKLFLCLWTKLQRLAEATLEDKTVVVA